MTDITDSTQEIWKSVLTTLRDDERITPQLQGFLSLVEPKGVMAGTLYLEVPNDLTRGMLEQRIRLPLLNAITGLDGEESVSNFAIVVNPEIAHDALGQPNGATVEQPYIEQLAAPVPQSEGIPSGARRADSRLNPKYNFDNFVIAFDQGRMLLGFVNTLVILVVAVTGTVLVGTAVAYALNRFDFRGRRVVVGLFLVATLVPGVTTQVATFQVVASMGLFNTRWSAVLLYMGTDIVSIYIFLQFMQSIPRSLDEAAMIDGASRFTIYYRIILPLLRPAIVTVVIIKGVAIYNEFYIPFLYMPSRDLAVISTSLFRFTGPFGSPPAR